MSVQLEKSLPYCYFNDQEKQTLLSSFSIDSDFDENCFETIIARDRIREYLEKLPSQRTEDDIDFLLEFLQHMPALSNMTTSIRRALCSVMVFVVIEQVGTVVLNNEEKLDGWSIIINGHVEVANLDGTIHHLHLGDSFGVPATLEVVRHSGVMVTKTSDCQFVFVPQADFYRIMNASKESIGRIEEDGELVMLIERKNVGLRYSGHLVLRAIPERLLHELFTDLSYDTNYIDDFLLTHKLFMKTSVQVFEYLKEKLLGGNSERAIAIVMRWATLYFEHFDLNSKLFIHLEEFIAHLFNLGKPQEARTLMSLSANGSRIRSVLCPSLPDRSAPFDFLRTADDATDLFVSSINANIVTDLRRGDQILSLNEKSIELFDDHQIYDIIHSSDIIYMHVKSNLEAYHRNLSSRPINTKPGRCCSLPRTNSPTAISMDRNFSRSPVDYLCRSTADYAPNTSRIKRVISKLSSLQTGPLLASNLSHSMDSTWSGNRSLASTSHMIDDFKTSLFNPYKSDLQTTICLHSILHAPKYFLITPNTTVKELIDQAIVDFNLNEFNRYVLCLFESNKTEKVEKKELMYHVTGLDDLYLLNTRLYICDCRSIDIPIQPEVMHSMRYDVSTGLLKLPASSIAHELTRRDFILFRRILSSDYLNEIFDLDPAPTLTSFSELVNKEMFWVITEICSNVSTYKRTKIIKHFIKISKCCLDLRNYNSMFAILSGLRHGAVLRLRQSWDRLPEKYTKLFEELQDLMDPSRNMSKYRNQLSSAIISLLPTIPFFPLIKKDLTFIHYGNDSKIDKLVNFDKLRMISKEIRNVHQMSSGTSLNNELGSRSSLLNISSSNLSRTKSSVKPPTASLKKKHDEDILMRSAKTYLSQLNVINNEATLLSMSILCEPHENVVSNSSASVWENITKPKFGSDSSKCVNKLMSLRENSKIKCPSESQINSVDRKCMFRSRKVDSVKLKPLLLTLESSSVSHALPHKPSSHAKQEFPKSSFCVNSKDESISNQRLNHDCDYDSGIDSASANPLFHDLNHFIDSIFNGSDSVFASPTLSSKSLDLENNKSKSSLTTFL